MPTARATGARPVTIETEDDIRQGCRSLRRKCKIMRHVHDVSGYPPLRRRRSGFAGIARIVVGQQLSVASAAAIWSRIEQGIAPLTPTAILELTDDELRAFGLSRPKIRTLRATAQAVVTGTMDLEKLPRLSEADAREHLTAISGIGPWTADIYRMFCIGDRDAFAPGDLALREAARLATGEQNRPSADELLAMAEIWRPWRGIAARLLWAYYSTPRPPSG